MKVWKLLVLLVSLLLTACGQPVQAPTTTTQEKPIFSDADIDKAMLQVANEVKELVGIDEGSIPEGQSVFLTRDQLSSL